MNIRPCILVLFLNLVIGVVSADGAELSLYGTFHAMGVVVNTGTGDNPGPDAEAQVAYCLSGDGYRAGFPLTRVSETRFVGSLFWLEPGNLYDVRVSFSDPGGPLHGTVLEASVATRAETDPPVPLNSYYVSPDGSGNACTAGAPCSLTQGLISAQAGDEVVLRGGVYYQGEIALPRSGTDGMPIVIRSHTGEEAVIDGGDPTQFAWTAVGSGVYSTVVHAAETHLVTVNGQRLFPYHSLTDLQDLKWGIAGFFSDGMDLYVHLDGETDPNTANMTVSRFNYAFYVEQDHIRFEDLTFRHFGRGSYAKAIYFNNANNNWVSGCTFAINDLGVGLKRSSHRNVIQDCEFYDTIFEWPWEACKTESGLEGGAIRFYDPVTGQGNIVRRNVFHDYFDGFGVCPESTFDLTNETDVYHNLVYRAGDDGMETDGQASNVRIWENTFHDVLMGISLAPVYTGPVYVLRNHIYRTGAGNNTYSGSPFKFNSGYDTSGTMYLFHNTCDAVLSGNNGIYIKAPGTWENIVARNNIWSGTLYALNNYNETQPIDFDYDNLTTTHPDEFVYWGSGPDRHMHDLLTFQTLTGQELHGLSVVPGFADPGSGDHRLDPESLLIDAGAILAGINDDYFGTAPDIGAFEFACLIDADRDGVVDGKDLALFAAAYRADCLESFAAAFGN